MPKKRKQEEEEGEDLSDDSDFEDDSNVSSSSFENFSNEQEADEMLVPGKRSREIEELKKNVLIFKDNNEGARLPRRRSSSAAAEALINRSTARSANEVASAEAELLMGRYGVVGSFNLSARTALNLSFAAVSICGNKEMNQDFFLVPERDHRTNSSSRFTVSSHSSDSENDEYEQSIDEECCRGSTSVSESPLFAVLDGHGQGGEWTAQFAAHAFDEAFSQARSLKRAVSAAHVEALDTSKRNRFVDNGATLNVLYIDPSSSIVTCANVGDSRSILLRKRPEGDGDQLHFFCEPLSIDHKFNSNEIRRIRERGGTVRKKREIGSVPRVIPGSPWKESDIKRHALALAMPRALGHLVLSEYGVSAEPSIRQTNSALRIGDLLIVASDGLWDHFGSRELTKQLSEIVQQEQRHRASSSARQLLTRLLTRLFLKASPVSPLSSQLHDNTTILLVQVTRFKALERPSSPAF